MASLNASHRSSPETRPESSPPMISPTRGVRNGALDGLRGLAVIAVMAYHVVPDPFTGGWLGVDVFFVLSGFLICSMLLRERERTRTIDYRRFLVRRARRLLPGLLLMLLAVLGAASIVETGGRRQHVAIDVISSALQVSNWRLILADESYFAKVAAPSPIRHTWSLGVQEQFYIIFPLVLLFLFSRLRTFRGMAAVFGVVGLASLASMILLYEPGTDPSRVYFGTETRFFELIIGVLGAVFLHRRARRAHRQVDPSGPRLWGRPVETAIGWCGLAALLLLVVLMFTVDEFSPWLFMGGLAGIAAMTMLIITAATSPFGNIMTRLLANRPLMKAGDMSYSLYIWHWPVIVYLAPIMQGSSELARQVTAVVATIAVSTVSYTFVENPIHRHGLRGLSRRLPRLGRRLAVVAGPVLVVGAVTLASTGGPATSPADEDLTVRVPEDPHYGKSAAQLPPDVPRHEVVLVGASTVAMLGQRGQMNKTPDVEVDPVASLGCTPYVRDEVVEGAAPPESSACTDFREQWVDAVDAADSPTVIFYLPTRILTDFRVDGRTVGPESPEYDELLRGILDEFDDKARQNGAERVGIINLPCLERPDFGDDKAVARSNDIDVVNDVNGVVADWAEDNGADVYDNYALLCPGDRYFDTVNGKPLYEDGLHYSSESAPLMWRWLAGQVRENADGGRE